MASPSATFVAGAAASRGENSPPPPLVARKVETPSPFMTRPHRCCVLAVAASHRQMRYRHRRSLPAALPATTPSFPSLLFFARRKGDPFPLLRVQERCHQRD
ncbi:hypothetical protein V8G54_037492 [Vigna mungo]|uniref:Uncharacterized protein n=1 Tax=Vigna mungo TaxID=3915 RepID=A0AAQ3RGJ5_VIGMU